MGTDSDFVYDVETEYSLIGFIRPVMFSPTFLIPFLIRNGSNETFVQNLDMSRCITSFAKYDADDDDQDYVMYNDSRFPTNIRRGDPGILAVLLDTGSPISGNYKSVSRLLRSMTRNMDLPPFFKLEMAQFLADEGLYKTAIGEAKKTFRNARHGSRWAKRERAQHSGSISEHLANFFMMSHGDEEDVSVGEPAHQQASAGSSQGEIANQWQRVQERLLQEVGNVEYHTWLRQMTLVAAVIDGEVTICLPTRFLRDWVGAQYGSKLETLWRSESPEIRRVHLRVGPQAGPAPVPEAVSEQTATPRRDNQAETNHELYDAFNPRFSFEAFVVGKPNEFAYACARRVAERPASHEFNPLFLYGNVGLGKTHLMHAMGLEMSRRVSAPITVAYMSAEKFMYRFIGAIRSQSTNEFKETLRSLDVLMVDDLQFLIGKDNTQEEFYYTFNTLIDAGKQIVVAADRSPSDLNGLEDWLRTRVGGGMVADLHATTFELRISILEAKATRAGVALPPPVLELMAQKIATNVRELDGALNRLLAHANLFNRPITLETTKEVLHDILKAYDRRITIEEIQKRVAEHFGIRWTDMSSVRRDRAVARPRQVAMFLAKHLTSRSLPEIGRKFGNRDHTTVMHAISRVTELISIDEAFAQEVELLQQLLR